AAAPRDTLLIEAQWPALALRGNDAAIAEMHWGIELVKGIRSVRAEMNVPASAKIPMVLTGASAEAQGRLKTHNGIILTLGRLSSADSGSAIPKGSAQFVLADAVV